MTKMTCKVCEKNDAIGVASSPFIPMSMAYCRDCLLKPAEALHVFHYLFDEVSTNGNGLILEIDDWFTVIDGEYVKWPAYVEKRRNGWNPYQ